MYDDLKRLEESVSVVQDPASQLQHTEYRGHRSEQKTTRERQTSRERNRLDSTGGDFCPAVAGLRDGQATALLLAGFLLIRVGRSSSFKKANESDRLLI